MVTIGVYSVDEYSIEDVARTMDGIQEILMLEDDYAVIYGITTLIDVKKASTPHLIQMAPSSVRKMTTFSEEALPFRTKGTHFINIPSGFEAFFNILKPMLSKKQQQRVSKYREIWLIRVVGKDYMTINDNEVLHL